MDTLKGNLFSVTEGILVHGCNAQGVMGSGVAAQVRSLYPGAYQAYRQTFDQRGLKLGEVVFHTALTFDNGTPRCIIANAITQQFYGREPGRVYASYEAIESAFRTIGELAKKHNLTVHFPLIGCGLAGGDWKEVHPRIERALGEVKGTLWLPA